MPKRCDLGAPEAWPVGRCTTSEEIKAPDESPVRRLIAEVAKERGGMEMSRLFFVAATTGARRAELCGLRWPDIDRTTGTITISRSILDLPGRPIGEKNTKTRRGRRRIEVGSPGWREHG